MEPTRLSQLGANALTAMTATSAEPSAGSHCHSVRNAAGYHRWRNLAFIHWRAPVEAVQRLLPDGLIVDTWRGNAWIGLVPFTMSGVRPFWSPPVPGVSAFHETNLRTYVRTRDGAERGVWFFSLEAASGLAVCVARWRWSLNYHRARMSLVRRRNVIEYASRRCWPGARGVGCRIALEVGPPRANDFAPDWSDLPTSLAEPGTLEYFLIERYVLFSARRDRLWRGEVDHPRYRLAPARLINFDETLSRDLELPGGAVESVLFCPGTDVKVFSLQEQLRHTVEAIDVNRGVLS